MGGKTKQSQRTKNNARPSSSSRSAELLNNVVSLESGLVNLSPGKVLPALFPTLAAANYEQGLQPEFQMCIKKLNKKDPITKTKALQELCELVNKSNVDDVVAALPSWAHFYKILTIDTDRKVCEMTQVCHLNIVRVCGRRVAPHLKQLLPSWLQAQYDDHAPAMTAAHSSLKNTFPDSKLPEVISFCKTEVMAHLTDNLIGNAEAIISKKTDSEEERELQTSRLMTSSLQGLEYFVRHLPAAHHAWLWAQLAPLLQANAFWKMAAHAAHQVRSAWLGAVGGLVERFKGAFGDEFGCKTLRLLLAAAKDQHSPVAAQLWTCLLQIMHNVEGWHTYLDKRELLTKRILDVLEKGGWGDARHLSNMLLPLLANLPQDMMTKDFYEAFFEAVFVGLQKKNVLNSKSERQSWITSLAECLRYLSVQQNDFAVGMATAVHRSWLERVLSTQLDGQTRNNLIKCSATNMTSIVKYWLKRSKEENSDKYDQLVRNYWENIGSTMLAQIDKCGVDHDDIDKLIEGHILLLQTSKASFSQAAKKQHSIKFHGDQPTLPEVEEVAPSPPCDATLAHRYKHNLEQSVHKICAYYFDFAMKKQVCSAVVTPLITLLIEFESEDLYMALARQFDADTVYKFYDKVLRNWLAGDTMRCKAVVDIVFHMMAYTSEVEQDMIFRSFDQLPPAVEEWCVGAGVRHPPCARAATRRWLRGASVARAARRLAAAAAHAADARAAQLLRACLTAAPDGELLIGAEAVAGVVEAFAAGVRDPRAAHLERGCQLAAQLAAALHGRAAPHYERLLLALLRLTALVPRGDPRLSAESWCEAREAWADGAAALHGQKRAQLLHAAADIVLEEAFQPDADLDIARLEHIVSLCPYLFSYSATAPDDVAEVAAFTARLFADLADSPAVRVCALRHECVTSQLNCLDENDNDDIRTVIDQSSDPDVPDLTNTDFTTYASRVLFRAIYLRTMLLHRDTEDEDGDETEQNWCEALLGHEYFEEELCKVIYDRVVVNSLHEAYGFWVHFDTIESTKAKLDAALAGALRACSAEAAARARARLDARGAARGYHWALAARWLRRQRPAGAPPPGRVRRVRLEDALSGAGFFHTLQAEARRPAGEECGYEVAYLVMLRSLFAAHADALGAEFAAAVARCRAGCDLDVVVDAYYRRDDVMLYERDVTDAPWPHVLSDVAVVEFLAAMVERCGWDAPAHHWDFTTITLCSLLGSVEKSKRNWGCTKVAMLTRAVLRLFAAVHEFVGGVRAESERRQPSPHVAQLPAEWRDIFAADTHNGFFATAVHVLGHAGDAPLSANRARALQALLSCCGRVRWESAGAAQRSGALALPPLAGAACAALQAPLHPAYKHFAHALLLVLAEPLVLADAAALAHWSEDADGDEEKRRPEMALDYFHDTFERLRELVEAALSSVVLGEETCEMALMSDSHSVALGWLLLADFLAELCELARGDLVHHYIQIFNERKYAEPLLTTALRLLPADVFAYGTSLEAAPAQHAAAFAAAPRFSADARVAAGDVGALACRCVFTAVCGAGCRTARSWWGAAEPRAARLLERLVRAYVAPPAARRQLDELRRRGAEIADASVHVAWSTREAACELRVEERTVELRARLGDAHPLEPPRLAAGGAGVGAALHWLQLYLAYQNGTLLNALKMWASAVSARIERSPQCYICYCRLQPATGRLPRVQCHQCHNKFHNACLRKWFTTSNKSSCPLCRAVF